MQELQEEIERRRKSMYGVTDLERIDLINETFEVDSQKLEKVRALWAKKGRDLALVERKLDDVPSRAELAQYQRMFVELYEQVATKLVETRRYYTTYNRLDDTRLCLDQEVKYLEDIVKVYETSSKDKAARERLLSTLGTIVGQIGVNIEKKEAELAKKEQQILGMVQQIQHNQEKIKNAQEALAKKEAELKQKEDDLARRSEDLDRLLADVEGRLNMINDVEMQLTQKEAELDQKQREINVHLHAQRPIISISTPVVHSTQPNSDYSGTPLPNTATVTPGPSQRQ